MKANHFSEEQKIAAVRQMDAGRPAAEVGREMGVSKHAIYAPKIKCRGMEAGEARRLKQLEDENRRLKQLVANPCRLPRQLAPGLDPQPLPLLLHRLRSRGRALSGGRHP